MTIQQFNNSTIQQFNNSTIKQSNNSTIQQFNNSTIQQFNNSTIQQFFEATKVGENCRFLIADFGLKCKYFYVPNFSFNGITCCVALACSKFTCLKRIIVNQLELVIYTTLLIKVQNPEVADTTGNDKRTKSVQHKNSFLINSHPLTSNYKPAYRSGRLQTTNHKHACKTYC